MSDRRGSKLETEPGDFITVNGQPYQACSTEGLNCNNCAFHGGTSIRTPECMNVKCRSIVWMTPLNYLTHRLLS
jgi:hypothetical protein